MNDSGRRLAVGIDVGGTFTDIAAVSPSGEIVSAKVLSVAADRAAGVEAALDAVAVGTGAVARMVHGTTVVTNLLLERRGARVVMCVTAGFTDIAELRRQNRASLYDLTKQHPEPLVPPERVIGVHERITPGTIRVALTESECARVAAEVISLNPEAVAICFLHAYQDSRHEIMLRDAVREAAGRAGIDCEIACSHEVFPEIREYERMTTTAAEVYARPVLHRYLSTLTKRLSVRSLPALQVMTSAGGTLPAAVASERAASLALSGPAGGVTGAAAVLRALGIDDALTIDIGGTSADAGLIVGGEPLVERGSDIGGIPIALPRVLVEAVAAGGGSIGWLDEGGALRAGPESAGADPGPACYGLGGALPTITDAHVVVGNIAPGGWSGGVSISRELAEQAIGKLATAAGVSLEQAAGALIATADATMARALRRISVERGIDPRDVVLVSFGGGGPLHACGLAEPLGITRIVIPPFAGVLSAVGLAIAAERREFLTSVIAQLNGATSADVAEWIARAQAGEALAVVPGDEGGQEHGSEFTVRRWLRTRYAGQGHELDLPLLDGDDGESLVSRFTEMHIARTGFALSRPVECISLRTALTGSPSPVRFQRIPRAGEPELPGVDDGREMTRETVGPAVVQLVDATMRVAPGWTAKALPIGGWMMERR